MPAGKLTALEVGRKIVARDVAEAEALAAALGVEKGIGSALFLAGVRAGAKQDGVCEVLALLADEAVDTSNLPQL